MSPQNVNFLGAIKLFFKNYVNFTGRSTRSEYWWYILFNFVVTLALMIVGGSFSVHTNINSFSNNYIYNNYLYDIWSLATFVPGLSLTIRRLHDTGRSWFYLLAAFIPIVGSIMVIVWLAEVSDLDNMWGFCANSIATGRGSNQVQHTGQYNPNSFYTNQQPTYNDPNAFYNGGQNQSYNPNGYYGGSQQQGSYNNPNAPYQGYQNQGGYTPNNQYGTPQQYPYQNQGGYNPNNQYGTPQQNYNPNQPYGNINDQQGFGGNNINNNGF